MNRLILAILFSALVPFTSAIASDGALVDLTLTATVMSDSEKATDPCYKLARAGEHTGDEAREMGYPHVWIPGRTTTHTWRITEFDSGMKCEVFIGGHDAQRNSNKIGCSCSGRLRVH
ncbi:hypothetical protein [Pseudobdellovibrio exovorus]|uniref:Uncharacterized protein n=1 Tax=Pseudobdellovibrio exovorus JSS TaxID=1184267 RepID=M4V797_9BACT|nr:hypothetical protein [Pseudobdellovibrio exovorus]AGH94310.1 hypothetical protein A11Q_90 [Pseudobdellovibrio exovorus JSS]